MSGKAEKPPNVPNAAICGGKEKMAWAGCEEPAEMVCPECEGETQNELIYSNYWNEYVCETCYSIGLEGSEAFREIQNLFVYPEEQIESFEDDLGW
jgi:hypothetical protein